MTLTIENLNQIKLLSLKIQTVYPCMPFALTQNNHTEQVNQDANILLVFTQTINQNQNITKELKKTICEFFNKRWQRIQTEFTLRYDTGFYLPLNQFCFEFCRIIAPHLNKNIYQLLIPTLQETSDLYGSNIEDFLLHHILITGDSEDNFLDLTTCFKFAINTENDSHKLYYTNKFQNGPESRVVLSLLDIEKLKSRDSWTLSIIRHLKCLQQSQQSIAGLNELLALRNGLLAGDAQHQGDELNAASPANEAMVTFQHYLESLSSTQREELFSLAHTNTEHRITNFRDLWHLLCHPEADSTSGELTINTCIYLRGQDLEAIINHNRDQLSSWQYNIQLNITSNVLADYLKTYQVLDILLPAFVNDENETIKNYIESIYGDNSENISYIIKTSLRLAIAYKKYNLFSELINMLNINNLNNYCRYLFNDMILYMPTDSLLEHLHIINATKVNQDGLSFIAQIIIANRVDIFEMLLNNEAELAMHDLPRHPQLRFTPCNMLKLSIHTQQLAAVELLLNQKVNIYDGFDSNAFIYALPRKNKEISETLANYMLSNPEYLRPSMISYYHVKNEMNHAIQDKCFSIFRVITHLIPKYYLQEAYKQVLHYQQLDILNVFFSDFPEVANKRLPCGETPLTYAIINTQNIDFINTLLCHGADINQPSRTKSLFRKELTSYPIIAAAKLNLENIIDLLLSNGANPSVTDFNGQTYDSINEAKTSSTRPRAL